MHTFRLIGAEIRKTQTEGFTEFGWKGTRGVTQNATGPHFPNEHFFALNESVPASASNPGGTITNFEYFTDCSAVIHSH
jgi:hypothetical protein